MTLVSFNLSNRLKNQCGLTLVELLVILSIGSLIAVSASNAIFQMFTVNDMGVSQMDAVKQLENVIYLIGRDSQMAQKVQTAGASGFPLTLSWLTWNNNAYTVVYDIVGSEVSRNESVNGGASSLTVVSRNVVNNAADTNCQFSSGELTIKMSVAVTMGTRTSTAVRSLRINPRTVS